jgi:hypothetical protein
MIVVSPASPLNNFFPKVSLYSDSTFLAFVRNDPPRRIGTIREYRIERYPVFQKTRRS